MVSYLRHFPARPSAFVALALAALTLTFAACAPSASSASQTRAANPSGASATPTFTFAPGSTLTVSALTSWKAHTSAPQQATSIAFITSTQGYLCAQNPQDYSKPAPGLFKTSDGGGSWTHIATPNPGLPCRVFLDPNDPNDLFIQQILSTPTGTGDPLQAALWRSRDGGATWSHLALIPHTNGWNVLTVLGSRLFALANPVYYGAAPCPPGSPAPAQFSTPSSQVYVSDDGGQSWSPLGASLVAQNMLVSALTTDGQSIYVQTRPVATDCSTIWQPITWRRLNSDNSWSTFSTPPASSSILTFWPAASGGMYALDVYAAQHAGALAVAVSVDRGVTWNTLPAITPPDGLINVTLDEAAVAPSGHVYAQIQTSSASYYSYPGGITFVLDPAQSQPTWSVYAVNHATAWSPTESGGSLSMWGLYFDNQNNSVASLPMP